MKPHLRRAAILAAAFSFSALPRADAAEIKGFSTGAFKQVVLALVPDFERQTDNKVIVDNDTAGGLKKCIEAGEAFDVAVITPKVIDELAAKSITYIDPARGGSSGIDIDKLLERLGIADQARPKAKLKQSGHAAGLSASATNKDAAQALIKVFSGPGLAAVLKSRGMEPAG